MPYISNCSDQIDIPIEDSVISVLLQDVHPKADKTYRIAMYALFEAISEVDGVISLSEREYLMSLLRLDDDDVTNDIVIDSIFTREAQTLEDSALQEVSQSDSDGCNVHAFNPYMEKAASPAPEGGLNDE